MLPIFSPVGRALLDGTSTTVSEQPLGDPCHSLMRWGRSVIPIGIGTVVISASPPRRCGSLARSARTTRRRAGRSADPLPRQPRRVIFLSAKRSGKRCKDDVRSSLTSPLMLSRNSSCHLFWIFWIRLVRRRFARKSDVFSGVLALHQDVEYT